MLVVVVVSLFLVLGNVERSIGQIQSELSEDQQMFVDAERAAKQLINMVSDENTVPPRLSEPQIAYLFSVAFSPQIAIKGADKYENVAEISELQDLSGKLVRAYLFSGIQDDPSWGQDKQQLNRQVGQNLLKFLDEIALAYDFSLLAGANIAEFVAGDRNFWPTEAERSTIAQAQLRILNSVLACSTDSAIDSPWRADRLAVINGTARNFAKLFDKKTAQAVADDAFADALNEREKSISDSLKRFALRILQD